MPPSTTLTPETKAQLAELVVRYGVAGALKDVDAIAELTCLTPAQIRKQLADNRANIRRQLLQFAQGMQNQ